MAKKMSQSGKKKESKLKKIAKTVGRGIKARAKTLVQETKHPIRAVKLGIAEQVSLAHKPLKTIRSGFSVAGQEARVSFLKKGGTFKEGMDVSKSRNKKGATRKLSKLERSRKISEGLRKSKKTRRSK